MRTAQDAHILTLHICGRPPDPQPPLNYDELGDLPLPTTEKPPTTTC